MSTIMVTGAAGYLGSNVVAVLLEQGHTVRGSLSNKDKVAHLLTMASRSEGRLKLFEADLLKPGSFATAATGADIIMHSASSYIRATSGDPQQLIITPAVEGTRNVLACASASPSVRRVVLTSSIAAMAGSYAETAAEPGQQLNEVDRSRSSTAQNNPYAYAKTTAEKLAWELCRTQAQWNKVCISPGAIFGPSLSARTDGESVQMVQQFIKGQFASSVPALQLGVVDVRDVALAHAAAAFSPAASGRYLAVNENTSLLKLARAIAQEFPDLSSRMPGRLVPKWLIWLAAPMLGMTREFVRDNVGFTARYDNSRSTRELGLKYRPLGTTMRDHVLQLRRDGLVA